jgi:hypothetical protein
VAKKNKGNVIEVTAEEVVASLSAEAAAERERQRAIEQCPIRVLRADSAADMAELVMTMQALRYERPGTVGAARFQELLAQVREFEVWREEHPELCR